MQSAMRLPSPQNPASGLWRPAAGQVHFPTHSRSPHPARTPGVTADFALNVRRTPLPIAAMREAHPDVFASLEACTAALQRWQPYPEAVREVIWEYMGLEVTEVGAPVGRERGRRGAGGSLRLLGCARGCE